MKTEVGAVVRFSHFDFIKRLLHTIEAIHFRTIPTIKYYLNDNKPTKVWNVLPKYTANKLLHLAR